MIGQADFVDEACLGGGGSSKVIPLYTVSPLDGLRDVLAGTGLVDDRVERDRRRRPVQPGRGEAGRSERVGGRRDGRSDRHRGRGPADANLLNDQNPMIEELLGVNPTTVVVLKDSNPVLMPWIDSAPAVLEVWNQGTEDGHVVADLLFGVVNPSGKLPTTYPVSEDDTFYAGHAERYPGTDEGDGYPTMRYSEGLQVGYRWFQSQRIAPLFGFGFGLSYTTFESLDEVNVDARPVTDGPV